MRNVCEEIQQELDKLKDFLEDISNRTVPVMLSPVRRLNTMVEYWNETTTQVSYFIREIERIINE